MADKQEQIKPPMPAWRTELSQRVREIRAKKEGLTTGALSQPAEQSVPEMPAPTIAPVAEGGSRFAATEGDKIGSLTRAKFMSRLPSTERGFAGFPEVESASDKRSNSKLVQDALTRVQRASENARRSSLPRIEPSRQQPVNSLVVDREATARVLDEPVLELNDLNIEPVTASTLVKPTAQPAGQLVVQPVIQPVAQPVGRTAVQPARETRSAVTAPRITQPLSTTPVPAAAFPVVRETLAFDGTPALDVRKPKKETERVIQLDEDHCLDYLEAEVERVDRELHERLEVGNRVSVPTHVLINLVDLCVIGVSSAPFLALIKITHGGFDDAGTRQSAAIICLAVAAFYLSLTQLLGNRTFGMMFTRTKLVNASTLERPTPVMVILRTAGYALSFAAALLGFLWVAFDTQRRSWHDRLSGTVIASDL